MLTIQDILRADASGPDAVKALCAPLSDDALRAEIGKCDRLARGWVLRTDRPECRQASAALTAELSRRTLVDPGWECECGHVNPDDAEYCDGEKCRSFREWAATQPQEDQ